MAPFSGNHFKWAVANHPVSMVTKQLKETLVPALSDRFSRNGDRKADLWEQISQTPSAAGEALCFHHPIHSIYVC